jgi:predicted enzyme related to lactoylglutathione lyase
MARWLILLFAIAFAAAAPSAAVRAEEGHMKGLQFRGVGLLVPDVPATVRFYESAFGLKLRYMHPSSGYAELDSGSTFLAFLSERFVKDANLLAGWIAVALVVFAGWRPWPSFFAAILFGCIEAIIPYINAAGIRVPQYLMLMTPYAATLAVMMWVGVTQRARQ